MRYLLVYNPCGIRPGDRTGWYIECLQSFLDQDHDNFEVVVSDCLTAPEYRQKLIDHFGDKLHYNWIDEKWTVNQTFNLTCMRATELLGDFDGYIYVDSGVTFAPHTDILSYFDQNYSDDIGFISILANNDNGTRTILGYDGAYPSHDMLVPMGQAHNMHVGMFHKKIYDAFDGRIIPDIFLSFCTESVYPFLMGATGTRWLMSSKYQLRHEKGVDGASAGFGHKHPWDHVDGPRTMKGIIQDPEAWECGFGYEECNNVFNHNPDMYINDICIDPERLRRFMRQNVFLSEDYINYNNIKHEFICGHTICKS